MKALTILQPFASAIVAADMTVPGSKFQVPGQATNGPGKPMLMTARMVAELRFRMGWACRPESERRHYETDALRDAVHRFIAGCEAVAQAERDITALAEAEGWTPEWNPSSLKPET